MQIARASLLDVLGSSPDSLRASGLGDEARTIEVEWPPEFGWTTLLVVAPRDHALHHGGAPVPNFMRALEEWQRREVATSQCFNRIKALCRGLKREQREILSLLGLPTEFEGCAGGTLDLPSTEKLDQLTYRVRGLLCSAEDASTVSDKVVSAVDRKELCFVIPAKEEDDLSRHYNPKGSDILFVDDFLDPGPNWSARLRRMLSDRLDALEQVLLQGANGKASEAPPSWILCGGYADLWPRYRGVRELVSGNGRLYWEVLRSRIEFVCALRLPVFYQNAVRSRDLLRSSSTPCSPKREFARRLRDYCSEQETRFAQI